MLYAETKIAAIMFGVKSRSLANAVARNSSKYPFVEILNTKTRGYSGKKLLFEISIAELKVALKNRKIYESERVYAFKDGGLKSLSLGEILYGYQNTENVQKLDSGLRVKSKIQNARNSEILSVNDSVDSSNLTKNSSRNLNASLSRNSSSNLGVSLDRNLTKNSSSSTNLTYFELTQKQKDEADKKIKLIKEQETSGLSVSDFCKVKNLSKTSFYRWKDEYKKGGAVALADKSGMHRKGTTVLEPWMQEFVLSKFRVYGAGNFNVTECTDLLNAEIIKRNGIKYGENITSNFSYCDSGVIKRFLDNYYKNRQLEYTLITKGEDKVKSYFQPAMGSHREVFTFRNQCWQIDSSPFDMIVRDDKSGEPFRPHILSIVDVYSGRGVVSLEKTSSSLGIIRLLWKALKTLGKPYAIKGDNGKDYLSGDFQELLKGLNIDYVAAQAYSGDQKGMVERRFRTLQHSGISMLPGYIGYNLKTREQIEQRTPKKDRKAKDDFGFKAKTNLKHLLNFSDARAELESLNMKWDLISGKRRKGKPSPMEIWNSDDTPLTKVEYAEFILYASKGTTRTVQKNGINYKGFTFVSCLLPNAKTKIIVRENIDDVSEIFVFDENGEFICVATERNVAQISAEELKISKHLFKKEVGELRKVIKNESLSDFTKLNVRNDLEEMKKLHKESLKQENWVGGDKTIKNKIEEIKKIDELKNSNGEYSTLPKPRAVKKKFIGFDELIENAV